MHYQAIALLAGASAVVAGNSATLLLPGFQGQKLHAGVLASVCVFNAPWACSGAIAGRVIVRPRKTSTLTFLLER